MRSDQCDQCREKVSAALDREASAEDVAAADAHLAGCPECRAWASQAERLGRRLRVRIADPVPDLSSTVAAAAGHLRRQRRTVDRRTAVRFGLVGVAAAQLALALPALGGHVHSGHEAASWAVAAAVGLLTAAASPRRVIGMLPMLSAAALVLVLTTVHDLVDRDVHIGHELPHGLLIAGVGLLWLLRDRGAGTPQRGQEVLTPRPARPGSVRHVA
jgi:predicted anti-sigma-YlaC factor YlaD